MSIVQGECTNCGATLDVDTEIDTVVCPYCNKPLIVEEAVKDFSITNNSISPLSPVNNMNAGEANCQVQKRINKKIFSDDKVSYDYSVGNLPQISKGLIFLIVGGIASIIIMLMLLVGVVVYLMQQKSSSQPNNSITTDTTAANTEIATMTTPTDNTTVEKPTAINPKASNVKLSKYEIFLEVGETDVPIIQAYPDAGTGESDEVWKSLDPAIAVVNASGYITGVSKGQTYVILSFKNYPDIEIEIKVNVGITNAGEQETSTVANIKVSDVKLSKRELFLEVGETDVPIIQKYPKDGMDESSIIWKSMDPAIAVVNSSGYITGVSKGQTYIVLGFKDYPDIEIMIKVGVGGSDD